MDRTVSFGPVQLRFRADWDDRRWREFVSGYGPYFSDDPGQLTIDVSVPAAPPADRPRLPNSFFHARQVHGGDFDLGEGLIRGSLTNGDHCHCEVHPILLRGCGLRVLEQFFYLLFYHVAMAGAERWKQAPFLLHSSGVLYHRNAYIFCGPSESGKSTAAQLCPARPVLGDECMVMQRSADAVQVTGSPVNPFFTEKEPGGGPLASLSILRQADHHAVSPIGPEEAIPRLTAEVMLPLGLLETDLSLGLARSLDIALLLHRTGLVNRLSFKPDPGFWPELADRVDVLS
jgi:hypothetical protein